MQKKILLVGEYSEGSMTLNCFSNLKALGHEVIPFTAIAQNPFKINDRLDHVLQKTYNFFLNKNLYRTIARSKPDLIFLFKAHTVSAKTIRKIKQLTSAPLINWYPDNPFTLWNGNSNDQILYSLPYYDAFFIWSKMLISPLESAGCKRVLYAPFGYHAPLFEKHIPITSQDAARFTSDVSFIGTWDPERQEWLEALVRRLPNINFSLWGNEWEKALTTSSPLRKNLRGQAELNENMIKVLKLSKISLNFIRRQNITAHNLRTMEIPASGGFQLAQRSYEHSEFLFTEGKSIACFETIDELVSQIKFYLDNESARQAIAQNGAEIVKKYRLSNIIDDIINKTTAVGSNPP